ncbi:MAG: B12-binding domain-containing radical SAM protein [Candidatus Woesearchaeota archaeon]
MEIKKIEFIFYLGGNISMNKGFNKVLLVTPSFRGEQYTAVLTAGIGYISESFTHAGIHHRVYDANLDDNIKHLIKHIHTHKPDLVGMSIMSVRYQKDYDLIKDIKKNFPDIKILVGGPHASTFRETMMEDNPYIDYGIILEGEESIIELCKGKELNEIKGLMYREDGKVVYTGDRAFIKDLDSIPFPRYAKYDLKKYPDLTIPLVSSRGCPYGCTFCPVKTTIGRVFRVRSPKNVVDEIEYWCNRGINNFGFVDDNFTFYKDRAHQICDEIKNRGITATFNLGNGIRADKVDYELLKKMRDVGFREIAIGVESANNHILKLVRKGETLEDIDKAVKIACDLGFEVGLFFILGSPGETRKDVINSFRFAMKYPVDYAYFYNIIPFPNSEMYQYLKENNLLLTSYDIYLNESSHWNGKPAFITHELDLKERLKLYEMGKKVTKKIQVKRITLRLRKLGPLAPIAARIISIDFIQRRVMTNILTKKIIIKIKKALWR